ncbi:PREDICTED: uncharacterized protein LOC104820434 [Tarenaya hassleriana]|uniref:uncharacterized protein LOC104820434 n=1 Tax=Tarenaya hassleriana TaxID=28532 RepID=UPI00053C81D5|nr:PREDICTED: uncharacterized protein LOC104820434 [Tarenaya hassleriana]
MEKGQSSKGKEVVNEEAEEVYVPPPSRPPFVPFPSRLKKHNEDRQFARFAEMLKKLEITMPFTEAILQMSSYTKFLKDILTKKRVVEKETVSLNTECSALIQHELPPKQADPGSFSIPCKLGNVSIDKALCDLGASVSLLPLSIFKKLNVGELKPTRMALQLTDRSVKFPAGILEDVPLKVGNFFVPVDFVVLDMDEDSRIGDETVEFTLDQNLKQPSVMESSYFIDMIKVLTEEVFDQLQDRDPLKMILLNPEKTDKEHIWTFSRILDTPDIPPMDLSKPPIQAILSSEGDTNLEITATNRAQESKETPVQELLNMLRKYRKVIGYTIADVKEINHFLCMHRIHLEDECKTSIEHQRRLNPMLQEVVKKEIMKLLDADIIFPISDSHWISEKGIEVDNAKVEVIEKLPPPHNVKAIRSFLGHAGFYRRFIKDFSKVSKSLTDLLCKDAPFIYTAECDAAFQTLKKALVSPPIIQPPD